MCADWKYVERRLLFIFHRISCGENHSLCVSVAGQLYAWGDGRKVTKQLFHKKLSFISKNKHFSKIEFMNSYHINDNGLLQQQPWNIYFSLLSINQLILLYKGTCFRSKTATCTLTYIFLPCPRAIQRWRHLKENGDFCDVICFFTCVWISEVLFPLAITVSQVKNSWAGTFKQSMEAFDSWAS